MMNDTTPTIAQASRDIAAGKLSPVALTDMMLDRIDAQNGTLNAFVTITADIARKQARHAEAEIKAGRYLGPMHGIPLGYKDIFETAGILTTGHSHSLLDRVPEKDC
ncbi:MAG: amidase family protein, partial [Burkholderiaceae bacterium]